MAATTTTASGAPGEPPPAQGAPATSDPATVDTTR
jgi:hypothetical protein